MVVDEILDAREESCVCDCVRGLGVKFQGCEEFGLDGCCKGRGC